MALPTALKSVLDNPLVKAALFKQLTKIMKDNSIEKVVLSLDESGKLKIDAYQEQMQIMPMKDYVTMLNKVLKPLE